MKVLHVIPGLANASGPTQALLHLVTATESAGAKVSVAYLGNRLENQIEPVLSHGTVYNCAARGFKHWGYSPQLRNTLNEQIASFDIVHLHSLWLYPSIAASRAARKHHVPYIVRPAGSLEPTALKNKSNLKRLYYSLIEKEILNHAALIHAVSEQERKNIDTLQLAPKCVTIPNGIDPNVFHQLPSQAEARAAFALDDYGPILAYVGRLHPIKGIELLIPVIQDLKTTFPKLRFLIGGPNQSPYAADLKSKFQAADIHSVTQFTGELDERQKILAYRAADLFLLPSKTENFAIVVAEALASETPVVVANTTPWQLVEQEEAGDWIERDPHVWTQTIRKRLQSSTWREHAGKNGRSLILDQFTWPSIGEQMMSLYRQVVRHWPKSSQV